MSLTYTQRPRDIQVYVSLRECDDDVGFPQQRIVAKIDKPQ